MEELIKVIELMAVYLKTDNPEAFRRALNEFNQARNNSLELLTDVELMQLMCEMRAKMSEANNDPTATYYDKENIRAELKVLREELRDRIW